jgi:predicted HTH domain antitoxin
MISQEKAAEIAGLNRADFIFSLSRFNVSPFQYTVEEIEKELSNAD